MKKYITLVCVSILLCTSMASKIYGADGLGKLKWRFDLIVYGIAESYQPRLMISYGPVSIGTAYRYDFGESWTNSVMGTDYSWFSTDNTIYTVDIYKGTPHGYFPLLIRYTPYSRLLGYGDINLYGFFHTSLWNREEWIDTPICYEHVYYDEQNDSYRNCMWVQFNPSFWYKIGVGLSFNPLRFIPFDISVGYLRTYYPYNRVPQPYKEHVSHTSLSCFYSSIMFSLGYQNRR